LQHEKKPPRDRSRGGQTQLKSIVDDIAGSEAGERVMTLEHDSIDITGLELADRLHIHEQIAISGPAMNT
jgi:hypothetical protein